MAVTEIRRLDHSIQSASKSVERLVRAIAPRPQKRGINVGIANDVEDFSVSIGTIGDASDECRQGCNRAQ
jgi:hypothetical protein